MHRELVKKTADFLPMVAVIIFLVVSMFYAVQPVFNLQY